MVEISRRSRPPERLRRERLLGLCEPQELYVENMVADGAAYAFAREGREFGYAVLHESGDIVEFYVEEAELASAWPLFAHFVRTTGASGVLAQSFDPLLMLLGLGCETAAHTQALLYRVVADSSFQPRADIVASPGSPGDIAGLAALSDDFFDDRPEIEGFLAAEGLLVYRDAHGDLIGAGVIKQVVAGIDGFDIGMVVAPRYRRRGYGAHIVRSLKAHCLARGWRPICGCAHDNFASRRTLERAGFASVHRLVEFAAGQARPGGGIRE